MPKVVFIHSYEREVEEFYLRHAPPQFQVIPCRDSTPDSEKIALVKDADFILLHFAKISPEVLRAGKKVRLMQLLSAGYDNVDLTLTGELGIPVANVGGANAEGVAEHAITLMLAVYRRLHLLDRGVREGKWLWDIMKGSDTFELAEKTVGIVGLGNIGRTLAKRLRGFDNKLLGYDVVPPSPQERELNIQRVSLDQLLRESDIVSIHVPLLKSTRGLIGRREFSLMKPSAIIVNTARGPIIDEAALIEALQQKRIMGAGLDVFEKEPVDRNNPLLKMDNVVLTPHAAGSTVESWPRRAKFAYENMQRVWEGKPPQSVVHPE